MVQIAFLIRSDTFVLAVKGGVAVCVGGVRSHGRVRVEMFENSGLALRLLLLLLLLFLFFQSFFIFLFIFLFLFILLVFSLVFS